MNVAAVGQEYEDYEVCRCLFCEDALLLEGRYRIETPLGLGSFSEVYKAFDIETGWFVAVKRSLKDVLYSRTFLRAEAATLASLDHPKLPRFEAFLQDAFLVEQYFDGKPLSAVLDDRVQLPEREVRSLLAQLLEVLQYLEEKGVVHRDIRPENILVDDELNLVALIDFGIAQRKGVRSPGRGIWHDAYAAPERHQRKSFGSKTDLFSVGVVGKVCLTGDYLFRSFEQPWQWHLNGNITSPEFAKLLEKMTGERAKDRISLREAKEKMEALPSVEASGVIAPRRHTISGYGVSLHPTLGLAAVTTFDGDVEILDVNSGDILDSMRLEEEILAARYSSDGRYLLAGGAEGTLYVFDENMDEIFQTNAHGDAIRFVSTSRTSNLFLSASCGELKVWSITGDVVNTHTLSIDMELKSVALSDDGQVVAVVSMGGELYIWQVHQRGKLKRVTSMDSPISAISFLPGSHRVATGHIDGTLNIWEEHSFKRPISSLVSEKLEGTIEGVVFKDMAKLVECRSDSLIRVWDVEHGDVISLLHHPGRPVSIDSARGIIATVGYGFVQLLN